MHGPCIFCFFIGRITWSSKDVVSTPVRRPNSLIWLVIWCVHSASLRLSSHIPRTPEFWFPTSSDPEKGVRAWVVVPVKWRSMLRPDRGVREREDDAEDDDGCRVAGADSLSDSCTGIGRWGVRELEDDAEDDDGCRVPGATSLSDSCTWSWRCACVWRWVPPTVYPLWCLTSANPAGAVTRVGMCGPSPEQKKMSWSITEF